MSHHSDNPYEGMEAKKLQELFTQKAKKLGATGKFPEGKLTEDDEGEIRVACGVREGKVVIEFGKSVKWIGFTKEQARGIGTLLIRKSDEIE